MYKDKTFIAIIPARGGSKRLPRKNILNLGGKPLIAWTIEAGLNSKYIDEVMVTTEDSEIQRVATEFGAKIPFTRPEALADDYATRDEVVSNAINYYINEFDKKFDYLVILQPTSPLRTDIDINKAIEYLFEKEADSVISVCEVEHPTSWSGVLDDEMSMTSFVSGSVAGVRSQDFQQEYRLNGAMYICNVDKFLTEDSVFLKENIFAYEMSQYKSVDIDNEIDFSYAEFLLDKQKVKK